MPGAGRPRSRTPIRARWSSGLCPWRLPRNHQLMAKWRRGLGVAKGHGRRIVLGHRLAHPRHLALRAEADDLQRLRLCGQQQPAHQRRGGPGIPPKCFHCVYHSCLQGGMRAFLRSPRSRAAVFAGARKDRSPKGWQPNRLIQRPGCLHGHEPMRRIRSIHSSRLRHAIPLPDRKKALSVADAPAQRCRRATCPDRECVRKCSRQAPVYPTYTPAQSIWRCLHPSEKHRAAHPAQGGGSNPMATRPTGFDQTAQPAKRPARSGTG